MSAPENNEQVFKSVCRGCHGGCGALLHVRDGRLVRVKPDPESPLNRGWMCVKGLNAPAIVNHSDRLKEPLRRKGKRGSGQWETIPWDEALGEISAKLDAIRQESGPEAIALGQGTGRHHYMHVVRFANALGTPNWYEPGLANCFIPRVATSFLTYGGFVTGDYYGDTPPECILFWGHNPLVSSADGELGINARRALENGAAGIAIDPRRSETAKKCDMWLPVRPGTDDALALAMIHVMIYEEIYDKSFVEKWTTGFEQLKEHVLTCTPQWAEKITWVSAGQIVKAARTYAASKPAVLEWGLAIEQNRNCLQTVRALAILRALAGNIDVPGGDILGMNILRSYPTLRFRLPADQMKKRLGADTYKLLGGMLAFMPSAHIPTLFNAMRTGDPYRVRALTVFGNNPLSTVANTAEVHESLKSLDLLTVTDLFMTPTAAMADYVLPAAYWPEVEQVIGYPLVVENVVMAQRKVVQVGNCRQDEWIIDQLSRRLDLPDSDKGLKDVMNYQLAPLGIDYDELLSRGYVYPDHKYKKYEEKGFSTKSGRIELYSEMLEKMGYDPLPVYKEPVESPLRTPDLLRDFPYVFTTGSRRAEFFHSEHRQVHALRRLRPDPQVEIHTDTAKRHAIDQGDWVKITSPRGCIRMRAMVSEDIHPMVINVEHGWWFPEKDGPDYGMLESNANVLTSNGPPYDPAFGTYHLRGLLCRIEKETDLD